MSNLREAYAATALACKVCAVVKPAELFRRGRRTCKACLYLEFVEWKSKNKQRYDRVMAAWRKANPEKLAIHAARRAKGNPVERAANNKRWREANRERALALSKEWSTANPQKRSASRSKWHRANRDRAIAYKATRRALEFNAIPKWANQFFIGEAYDLAARRSRATGFKWHVDHIVPLNSRLVCGLHCEHNLQVIPAAQNLSKNNRTWPDMGSA